MAVPCQGSFDDTATCETYNLQSFPNNTFPSSSVCSRSKWLLRIEKVTPYVPQGQSKTTRPYLQAQLQLHIVSSWGKRLILNRLVARKFQSQWDNARTVVHLVREVVLCAAELGSPLNQATSFVHYTSTSNDASSPSITSLCIFEYVSQVVCEFALVYSPLIVPAAM